MLLRKHFNFTVFSKKASRTRLANFFLSNSEKPQKWEFTFSKCDVLSRVEANILWGERNAAKGLYKRTLISTFKKTLPFYSVFSESVKNKACDVSKMGVYFS